jgi:ferredoxin
MVTARPPFPAEKGPLRAPSIVNNVETLSERGLDRAARRRALRRVGVGKSRGTKVVCLNERFVSPGLYEVPLGDLPARPCVEELGGGHARRAPVEGVQIGGPLGGISPRERARHPARLRGARRGGRAARARGHRGVRRPHRPCAISRCTSSTFGDEESCGKCFPCRLGMRRGRELVQGLVDGTQPYGDPLAMLTSDLCETLQHGSLCAHGGGLPAPIRSIVTHWPEDAPRATFPRGRSRPRRRRMSDALRFTLDGRVVLARDGETVLDVATREGTYIPTLCFDPRLAPFGACRACLVGVQGARGPVAACTTPVREGMVVDTRDPVAFRVGRGVVELVLSDFPEAALARDDDRGELRAVARHFGLESLALAGRAPRRRARRPPPLPQAQARRVHRLRPLRARVRRGPGHLRAHVHGPRLRDPHRAGHRQRIHGQRVRLVRRVRVGVPDGRARRGARFATAPGSTARSARRAGTAAWGARLDIAVRDGQHRVDRSRRSTARATAVTHA